MKLYVKLLVVVGGGVGEKKTKLMLYSTLVEVEVELGNFSSRFSFKLSSTSFWYYGLGNDMKINFHGWVGVAGPIGNKAISAFN